MYFRTNDPYKDLANHDEYLMRMSKKLPVCANCGEPIFDDYMYKIDGEALCEDCLNKAYRVDVECDEFE